MWVRVDEKEEKHRHSILHSIVNELCRIKYFNGSVAKLYNECEDLSEYKDFFDCEPFTYKTAEQKVVILYSKISKIREIINNSKCFVNREVVLMDKDFQKRETAECREIINSVYKVVTEWMFPVKQNQANLFTE